MKKLKLALVTATLASVASVGWAQDKVTLIKQFTEMQKPGYEMLAREIVQASSQPVVAAGGEYLNTRVPQDKREAAGKAADEELKKYSDEVFPIVRDKALQVGPSTISPILEQDFNEDELKTLLAWLNSPVSKKYAESAQKMQQAIGRKVVDDTRSTIEPKLEKLNVAVAKALGAPTDGGQAGPKSGGNKAPAKK